MKSAVLKMGIPSIMLVFGLVVFAGCPSPTNGTSGGGSTNPLLGTWYRPGNGPGNGVAVKFLKDSVQTSQNVQPHSRCYFR